MEKYNVGKRRMTLIAKPKCQVQKHSPCLLLKSLLLDARVFPFKYPLEGQKLFCGFAILPIVKGFSFSTMWGVFPSFSQQVALCWGLHWTGHNPTCIPLPPRGGEGLDKLFHELLCQIA